MIEGPRAGAPRLRVGPAAVAAVVAAVVGVALAARVSVPVPGTPVPQSLQTLAVVIVGGALGARRGAVALVLYAASGALGLPVFADGASGVAHLVGPTAGYLAGFVAGAAVMGLGVAGRRSLGAAFAAACVAHAFILGCGWARLSLTLGAADAWTAGVAPFLVGAVVKAAAAAVALATFWRIGRSAAPGPATPSAGR